MKKILVAILVLAHAAGLAAGVPLTIWTPFTGTTLDHLEADADAFAATLDTEVRVVSLDLAEIKTRMLLSDPGEAAVDVMVGVPHDQMAQLAAGGLLSGLSGFATASYLEDLSDQARLAFTYDGELYGLPLFVEGPALMYNRDLVDEVPATYEAFLDLAAQLTTGDRYGFMYGAGNFYFDYAWLRTHGGYVFGRENGTPQPDDVGLANAGAVRGARELRALRHEHGLIPPDADHALATQLFADGRLAMTYTGPWSVAGAREAGIDVGIAPMPPLADGTPWSGFAGVQGVLVHAYGQDTTDAVNLAKWLTRPEAQVAYAERAGHVPASRGALARMDDEPIIAGFGAALLSAEPLPNIPEMGRVWAPMERALHAVVDRADPDVPGLLEEAVESITGR